MVPPTRPVRWRLLLAPWLLWLCACGDAPDTAELEVTLSPPDAPLDTLLAQAGREDFRKRGCAACHQIGEGRLVGPDLLGVTRRRGYDWYTAMVTRPDSMILTDSTAIALLRQYAVPMPNQRVRPDQVRSIWEYLRWSDLPPEPSP